MVKSTKKNQKLLKVNRKIVCGSWKDGSDIYKDKNGYYIIQYNPKTNNDYKKYLKTWKPITDSKQKYKSNLKGRRTRSKVAKNE